MNTTKNHLKSLLKSSGLKDCVGVWNGQPKVVFFSYNLS